MASHVVVIDSTARRTLLKVSPTKHLSEVLEEACSKLGAVAANSGLKHNDKAVDLSRTFRLSGLSSGAKLHLIQISRSASPVSVALQMVQSEGNIRMTDKFPSTTTLWLVLRKFESGCSDDGSAKHNLTSRGVPSIPNSSSGAGRLYYQIPIIHVMGRELSSFEDLQKTLAQLGFNSGSTLLRLSFRTTETPLEEAMVRISDYFKPFGDDDDDDDEKRKESHLANDVVEDLSLSKEEEVKFSKKTDSSDNVREIQSDPKPPIENVSEEMSATAPESTALPASQATQPSFNGRSIQIFSPPTSSTPSAALIPHNPADYVPTIEHATAHQRHLQHDSHNVRLLSESELADQSAAEAEKLKSLKEVEIKIRFPDQSSAVSVFGQADSGAELYSFVCHDCLDPKWRAEKFVLSYASISGLVVIPDDPNRRLIQQLGLNGRILVNFKWDERGGASLEAMRTKNVLKEERKQEARPLRPPPPIEASTGEREEEGVKVSLTNEKDQSGDKKQRGVPKWLKLPGKK